MSEQLQNNNTHVVRPDQPLEAAFIDAPLLAGYADHHNVVAELHVGDSTLAIIRPEREYDGQEPSLIVSVVDPVSHSPLLEQSTVVGLDMPLSIGRQQQSNKQLGLYDMLMSRNHAELRLTRAGTIIVEDKNSANGTVVKASGEVKPYTSHPEVTQYASKTVLNNDVRLVDIESGRNEQLFAILPPRPTKPVVDSYDYLFTTDDQELADANAARTKSDADYYEALKHCRPEVDEKSKRNAADRVVRFAQTDKNFSDILKSLGYDVSQPLTIVESLHADARARAAVGSYLLDKVNTLAQSGTLPDRVQRNTQKNPNFVSPYYKLNYYSSREVAALYALAELDGTWDGMREDTMQYDTSGAVLLGQHREAAQMILSR